MQQRSFHHLLISIGLALALAVLVVWLPLTVRAQEQAPQGTAAALGTAFTYQGRLTDGGSPANGAYDFQFKLYDASTGGSQVGGTVTKSGVSVSNGLFSVELDFGDVFDGTALWLEVAVKKPSESSYTTLGRQKLTAAPYAAYARKAGSVPWSGLTGVPAGFADGTDDVGLTSVTWSDIQNRPAGLDNGDDDTLGGLSCSNGQVAKWNGSAWACAADDTGGGGSFWSLTGNAGTNPNTNFLGTTDNVTLTLAVNGTAALRLGPTTGTPNILGGYSGNSAGSGVVGATIGGGGANGAANQASANYATVGGGASNEASGDYATVGGGDSNTASGYGATVGGGNTNRAIGDASTIAGGASNQAVGLAAVGGGLQNNADGDYAAISGGQANSASGAWTAVGGGLGNQANSEVATVGGGTGNIADGIAATVGGGDSNTASGDYATVGGGASNEASGYGATVAGGITNTVTVTGTTIGGGADNIITGTATYGTIAGGRSITVTGQYAAVGGGKDNTASGWGATVGGGRYNTASNDDATVGGGSDNTASGILATIGGGDHNSATGYAAAVGGGRNNVAGGDSATVPGGASNQALGAFSFAAGAGAHAMHDGSFVWSDSLVGDVYSPGDNTFIVRANGGIWFGQGMTDITPTIGSNVFISTSTGAYLSTGGVWTDKSDRNAKENFQPVDPQTVLEQVAQLPITTWNYKAEDDSIRHLGPVAQDFYAAFGLGTDDTHIAPLDANGVALASIQGLYQQNQQLQAENEALRARVDDLEERVETLEALVSTQPGRQPMARSVLWPAAGVMALVAWAARRRQER